MAVDERVLIDEVIIDKDGLGIWDRRPVGAAVRALLAIVQHGDPWLRQANLPPFRPPFPAARGSPGSPSTRTGRAAHHRCSAYLIFQLGLRFSAKASGPSFTSSDCQTAAPNISGYFHEYSTERFRPTRTICLMY